MYYLFYFLVFVVVHGYNKVIAVLSINIKNDLSALSINNKLTIPHTTE